MNKTQALIIALVMSLMLTVSLPAFLADFEVGYDLPLIGHVSLFEPNQVFGTFFAGAIISALIMYVMINERRKRG